jgi:hypothetical protein
MHDRIFSQRGEVVNIKTSLTPPHCIEVAQCTYGRSFMINGIRQEMQQQKIKYRTVRTVSKYNQKLITHQFLTAHFPRLVHWATSIQCGGGKQYDWGHRLSLIELFFFVSQGLNILCIMFKIVGIIMLFDYLRVDTIKFIWSFFYD